jgi:hypothetical protein
MRQGRTQEKNMKRFVWAFIRGVSLLGVLSIQAHGIVVPSTVLEQEALSTATQQGPVAVSTQASSREATLQKLKDDERRLSEVLRDLQADTKKLKASKKQ